MKPFEGKSILLAVPNYTGIPERFKENLEHLGFEVYSISNYKKLKIGYKKEFIHLYKKITQRIKTYKKDKKQELTLLECFENLQKNKSKKFDFALFIRPDDFSANFISLAKKLCDNTVAYQWDGLDVFPEVYNRIPLFDRFFVFDSKDTIHHKNLYPLTNFYFDDISSQINTNDVYFLGNYKEDRIDILIKLAEKLREIGLKPGINLRVHDSKQRAKLKNTPITVLDKEVSFLDNILNVSNSKIIVDVSNSAHQGLSMRPFEALGYHKKLITNNALIKTYDFYDPNNIFIIEEDNLADLGDFINLPYQPLSQEILNKYSFTNWIRYVLNVNPYTPINFPNTQ